MRGVSKLSIVAVAAALLVASLGACGGDSDSSTTEATSQGKTDKDTSTAKKAKKGKGKSEGKKKSSNSGGGEGSSGKSASEFTPEQHSDSGGGSKQYRAKGGDNSVQEYGEEAPTSEFDQAAIALHNFLDARAQWNWAAACEYMAKNVYEGFRQLIARSQKESAADMSCAEVIEAITSNRDIKAMREEAAKANVGSVRIEGDRGFVLYTPGTKNSLGRKTIVTIPMVKEDGQWKVGSITGTPLN